MTEPDDDELVAVVTRGDSSSNPGSSSWSSSAGISGFNTGEEPTGIGAVAVGTLAAGVAVGAAAASRKETETARYVHSWWKASLNNAVWSVLT